MSEDARGVKARTRVLYVANPSSDSEGSEEDRRGHLIAPQVYDHTPLRPNRSPPAHSHQEHPPPLTTTLPQNLSAYRHPSSSPSSTSSPAAEESTPPPSTPAPSAPSLDLPLDVHALQDFTVTGGSTDKHVDGAQPPTSRRGKILQTIKSSFHQSRNSRPGGDTLKRPRTSPTIPTVDSQSNPSLTTGIPGKVLIVVTTDSDWYVTVDITGAKNAVVVRECIFNKLNIRDDDQLSFSIYQTEMGAYAIGDALTDDKLFSLCRDYGDSKGSLKFFVSHSSAPVHEQLFSPHSPTATTIPPPVLPYNENHTPLRPKRRSRQESISSASEQYPLDCAAGYEADLDNPDSHKPSLHSHSSSYPLPLPTHMGGSHANGGNPPSPRVTRRPVGQVQRPPSPPLTYPQSSTPPSDRPLVDVGGPEAKHIIPPPPLSPNRPTFSPDDYSSVPTASHKNFHERSGSELVADRDSSYKSSEHSYGHSGRLWRGRQHAIRGKSNLDFGKDNAHTDRDPKRRRQPSDVDELSGRADQWVLVSSNIRSSEQENSTIQESHRSSSHIRNNIRQQPLKVTSPFTGRPLAIPNAPRQPPPAAPAINEPRAPVPRAAGIPISSKVFVAWRGEERGDLKSRSTPQWNRLTKGAKSMDNLRASVVNNHPTTLQPGARRIAPAQLPITRPTAREPVPFASPPMGIPKSYEPPRPLVRPLPLQGPMHSSNLDAGKSPYSSRTHAAGLTSPDNDPCPRPNSALGHSTASSSQRHHHLLQSPTSAYTETTEPGRSARDTPLSNPYHHAGIKADPYGIRMDRLSDGYAAEISSYTTPPRTPVTPLSPNNQGREREKTLIQSDGAKPERKSESTLTQEDKTWLSTFIAESSNGLESTFIPQISTVRDSQHSTAVSEATFTRQFGEESDSGGDDFGTSMWKKRPISVVEAERPKSIQRPPLKVQIQQLSSGSPEKTSGFPNQVVPAPPILPSRLPPVPPLKPRHNLSKADRVFRQSTFTDVQGSDWEPRPPPEDVYERLEEFFPEHDLDNPVIEGNSGGISPTATEPLIPVPPVPAVEKPRRGKKSIRIVAEEHKKLIDRSSRADPTMYANIMRKRSTKLWGSKVEEVTTVQAKGQSTSSIPESPSGGPTTFKWVRGELIGRGTYGRVYLALNATTGEMMAVKQVEMPRTPSDKNDSRQITVVQALKLESETLKDLDHPNIVQYLGFEETPTNLSIFLEYVPGGSIGSCLAKHGKFDPNVTKSFTGQILEGLEYLHSRGILHRDLKADNILVEMSGVCKISDFGISKRTDDEGGAFTAMQGTVFWMAPEVIKTQKKGYNSKIDIWSVGCVVLEMWAGMRPWMGDEVVAVMFKLYQAKLPPPVPEGVVLTEVADDFRRKCFAINPEERPTAAELRRHPFLILPLDWVFTDFT